MTASDRFLDRVQEILLEAKAKSKDEREAFVRARCAGDERLQREVEAMLRAETHMKDGFLDRPATSALTGDTAPAAQRVGPWAIDERLGMGGMGAVFRGHRADGAFEGEVAIKFVREAIVDPTLRDRFLRERQILATLEHPNIARLVDGGVSDGGHPYLVMELVRGESLLEYCDAKQATVDDRLELFATICDAVQHAHGKLVVHRDLKPANILVDESGRARLVDFGIASMIDDAGTGATTVAGERRFTPQYAAPEQVRGEPATVATDVYALGVILYELLAGRRPYEVTGAQTPKDARTICEIDPPRPSRSVDANEPDAATDATEIARVRGTEPARLRRTLRGDLDHIVMTALRKEPRRRYATVEALRADLQRCCRGLPINARPDSWSYRTARFIGRHRVPVAATVTFGVVLCAVALIATALAVRLNARTEALGEALQDRQAALDRATAQEAATQREFRRALASSSTLIKTIDAVAAADESTRQHIVDEIRSRSEQLEAMTMPLSLDAEIATLQALAWLARAVDAHDLALGLNERVVVLTEDRHEEFAARKEAFGQLGWLHLHRDEPDKAIEALRAARAIELPDRDSAMLRMFDALLVEALVIVGDVEGAQTLLAESTLPPAPADALLRAAFKELEAEFEVELLPDEPD